MGDINPSGLCEGVEELFKKEDVGELESRIEDLSTQVRDLQR